MKRKIYDFAVIGLGGHGSSILYNLSKLTPNVIGIEQYKMHHSLGSTSGDSRIIRKGIFEGKHFVPIVNRSYQMVANLQKYTDKELFRETGTAYIGCENESIVSDTISALKHYNYDYDVYNNTQFNEKFPFFNLKGTNKLVVLEKEGGQLFPKNINELLNKLSLKNNASTLYDTKIHGIHKHKTDNTYKIRTTTNEEIEAKKIIVSVGPWMKNFVKSHFKFDLDLTILMNFVFYFRFKNYQPHFQNIPNYIFQCEDKEVYGFPDYNNNNEMKIAIYKQNLYYNSYDEIKRDYDDGKLALLKKYAYHLMDHIEDSNNVESMRIETCLFTMTKDSGFIVDHLPDDENILIVSPCSGHGYKYTLGLGEHIAKLMNGSASKIPEFSINNYLI